MAGRCSLPQAASQTADRILSLAEGGRLLISVDGRSTAGKSTFADLVKRRLPCHVVHADDFYLHPAQRTPERYATPGGNLDYERLKKEVIWPWLKKGSFCLRPYDAHADIYLPAKPITGGSILVIEGSYSGHPALWDAYNLHVFLTTDRHTQLARITARNGADAVPMFLKKWIPLEELYFSSCRVEERSDLCFFT